MSGARDDARSVRRDRRRRSARCRQGRSDLETEDTFFGSPDQNFTTLEAHILRGRIDHAFNDQLRGNVTLQYADYAKVYQNLYPSEEVAVSNGAFPEVELDGYRDTTDRQNLILQANLVGEFEFGGFGHTLLAGFEYDQETDNARTDNVFAANGDDQLFIPFWTPSRFRTSASPPLRAIGARRSLSPRSTCRTRSI